MMRVFHSAFRAKLCIYIIGALTGVSLATVILWPPRPYPIVLVEEPRILETCEDNGLTVAHCMAGERLKIRYHVKWNEVCPTYVDIYIFKDLAVGQDEIVYRNGPILAAFDRGDNIWVRDVFIPPHLKTGSYYYRARLTGRCHDREWPLAVPDMYFQIMRPR